MSDEAARLHAEAELARRSVTPVPEGIFSRKPIKSIVHLDGVEISRVQVEPLRRRTLLRVHRAAPMLIVPARGADPYLRAHSSLAAGRPARSRPRGSCAPAAATSTSGGASLPCQSAMGGSAAAFPLQCARDRAGALA